MRGDERGQQTRVGQCVEHKETLRGSESAMRDESSEEIACLIVQVADAIVVAVQPLLQHLVLHHLESDCWSDRCY